MSRSRGGRSFMTSPPILISPAVMGSSPAIIRNNVDFPHPEGPTNTTNSPSSISRSTFLTATVPSANTLLTPFKLIEPINKSPPPHSPWHFRHFGSRPKSHLERDQPRARRDFPAID